MPKKAGAKPVWVYGDIHAAFKAKLEAEGWRYGIAKKVESLMVDYVTGAKVPLDGSSPVHLSGVALPASVGEFQERRTRTQREKQAGEHPSKGRRTLK